MVKMLTVDGLTVSFSGKRILDDVSVYLKHGEILGIVGESGSGKSTLIRAIMDMLPSGGVIDAGNITLCNKCINKLDRYELRSLRGNDVAMIFQNPSTYLNPIKKISVQFIETIMSHRKISKSNATELIRSSIMKMNLSDPDRVMNSYPFELSGGMLQRVYIAMAIALQPKLILADEPTSALDVSVSRVIIEEMMGLRDSEGTSIVIVTHDIGIASYIADRIVVMRNGKVVETGSPGNIINNPQADYTKSLIDAVPRVGGICY